MFAIICDQFRWAVGNYARMPGLTAEQRERAAALVDRVVQVARKEIDKGYPGLEEGAREALALSFRQLLTTSVYPYVANYFDGRFVCPPEALPSEDEIAERLIADCRRAAARPLSGSGLDIVSGHVAGTDPRYRPGWLRNKRPERIAASAAGEVVGAVQIVLLHYFTRGPDPAAFHPEPMDMGEKRLRLSELVAAQRQRESELQQRLDAEAAEEARRMAQGFQEAAEGLWDEQPDEGAEAPENQAEPLATAAPG
jgi:hypothetical protein